MGFFDSLRRVLGGEPEALPPELAPGGDPDDGAADGGPADLDSPDAADASLYDRNQWHKKLKRILDGLPATSHEWHDLALEARALKLDAAWVTQCQVEEFLLLVRRAVSDRHFSEDEHRKLDLARDLIGIPEAEAEAALHSIVAEAETFFGKRVKGQ